jgi:hypothetical protein
MVILMLAKEALKKEKRQHFLSFSISCTCTGATANSALIAKAINAKSDSFRFFRPSANAQSKKEIPPLDAPKGIKAFTVGRMRFIVYNQLLETHNCKSGSVH